MVAILAASGTQKVKFTSISTMSYHRIVLQLIHEIKKMFFSYKLKMLQFNNSKIYNEVLYLCFQNKINIIQSNSLALSVKICPDVCNF